MHKRPPRETGAAFLFAAGGVGAVSAFLARALWGRLYAGQRGGSSSPGWPIRRAKPGRAGPAPQVSCRPQAGRCTPCRAGFTPANGRLGIALTLVGRGKPGPTVLG